MTGIWKSGQGGSSGTGDYDPAGSAQTAQDYAIQRSNHTGTQALATISDAGTAAASDVTTSATDTTGWRLIKMGDFGIGASIQTDVDPNNIIVPGVYSIAGAGLSEGSTPLNFAGSTGVALLWVNNRGANQAAAVAQRFLGIRSGGGNRLSGREFVRYKYTDTEGWTPWVEVFNSASILGTVSQSGGVPTGAIIERGSNANGEYVKFADGTMFCFGQVDVTDMTLLGTGTFADPYRSSNYDIIFPATFANVSPAFSCSVRANTTSQFEKIYLCGYTKILSDRAESLMVYRYGGSSSTIIPVLHWQAIGRWY